MKHDREMLAEHGTELMTLKPSALRTAAEADLRRFQRNADKPPPGYGTNHDGYEHYAFHRRHVRKAVDVRDLLVRALMDPVPGLASGKYNTRLIYGNAALLLAAIDLTREEHA